MTAIQKILIANRGEIACRIIRTCHQMGISSVAVFSDADKDALFVKQADQALHIGPAPSAESYLLGDKIIAAAKASDADAIHPGYGFLAEDENFARSCTEAGLVFIGPSADAIALLGSKQASKELVSRAKVPVVPHVDLSDPENITYPIMLKASAGGGGKGMQIVSSCEELAPALESAKRVAASAFGDSTMLAESYIANPRHIEIQILGDQQGNLVHLFERECSIQRRHQKIIEESPAPGLSPDLVNAIAEAALAVARAANYHSAGTVEFIVAPSGEFYFLEVNTRLQVEHPITECVTGIDIVREQIRIAQGEALGYSQQEIQRRGAAMECRLYAEDSAQDFLPCSGTLADWHLPPLDGLRVDTGVVAGSDISIHYDPLIAKLITHGPSRQEARLKMQRALRSLCAPGLVNNRSYLLQVLAHEEFCAGTIDTGFLQRHKATLAPKPVPDGFRRIALFAAVFEGFRGRLAERQVLPTLVPGFRNNRWRGERVAYKIGEEEFGVQYQVLSETSLEMQLSAPSSEDPMSEISLVSEQGGTLVLSCDGHQRRFQVTTTEHRCSVQVDGLELVMDLLPRFPSTVTEAIAGACVAPMPAKVIQVLVQEGQHVAEGAPLLVLEAMKMEHLIRANADGLVDKLHSKEGDLVKGGELLAVVTPQDG